MLTVVQRPIRRTAVGLITFSLSSGRVPKVHRKMYACEATLNGLSSCPVNTFTYIKCMHLLRGSIRARLKRCYCYY